MRARLLPLAALLLVTTSACRMSLGQERGAWHVLRSQHFVLYTDLAPRPASAQIATLEAELYALHHTSWEATGDLPHKLNVVVFRTRRDFETFAEPGLDGYMAPALLFEPWIVIPATTYNTGLETLVHELSHFMAFQAMPAQPRWFAEGLAAYFQTARFARDGEFQVGLVPRGLFRILSQLGPNWLPPSRLLAGDQGSSQAAFYASAWLFVHYLMNERDSEFAAYQTKLAHGLPFAVAFQDAFPRSEGRDLDRAVREYARAGEFPAVGFRIAVPHATSSLHPLSSADEYALRALLWAQRGPRGRARAHQDARDALARDPDNLWAGTLLVQGHVEHPRAAYERARALVATHPKAWLAWLSFGLAAAAAGKLDELVGDPGTDPGHQARQLAPGEPFAVMLDGMCRAARGEYEAASEAADLALRMRPHDVQLRAIHDALAQSLRESAPGAPAIPPQDPGSAR